MLDPKKVDMDILDQIIQKCEDHMVSPFKKKSAVAIEVDPKSEEQPDDEEKDTGGLSDDDIEELLQAFGRDK